MKQSLFVLAAAVFLLNLASTGLASDNASLKQPGGWLQDEQEHTPSYQYTPVIDEPSINSPTLETVWEHGQTRVQIRWDGLAGNLVKGSLLKNGTSVENILDWHENSESAVISEVLSSWGSGSGFQIRLEDNLGNFLLSDEFRIMAPINITEPTFGTTWAHSQTGVPIRWSGAQGNTVTIELMKSGNRVAILAENVPNTGEYVYNQPISQYWEAGGQYSVRIRDSIGNVYDSRTFSVNSIYVTSPSIDTVWSNESPRQSITWLGGSRAVNVSLYNGSQIIASLSDWTDNTGELVISNIMSLNIDNSDMLSIFIEDDQGNTGSSVPFSLHYTASVAQGAISTSSEIISDTIPPLDNLYFSKNMSEANYRINLQSEYPVNISYTDAYERTIFATDSSIERVYFSQPISAIRVSNQSNSDNVFSLSTQPLRTESVPAHSFYLDWAFAISSTGGGGGLGSAYYYRFFNNFNIGIDHSITWCSWALPDTAFWDGVDYRLTKTSVSAFHTSQLTRISHQTFDQAESRWYSA